MRLFPNRPEYRYRGRVHETIDAAILAAGGRLRTSAVRIHHHPLLPTHEESAAARTIGTSGRFLREEIAANLNDDIARLDFLAAEYHQLEMFDEAAEVAERIVRARPMDLDAPV